ncbi:MAG: CopG family transcriptional regulator [Burkholderiales bacterium]
MRTTLAIDDDVLAAVKGLAARQKKTVGQVISELVRQSLRPEAASGKLRNGVPLLPVSAKSRPVTLEVVNSLRDESP